jgi:hypothetical protein
MNNENISNATENQVSQANSEVEQLKQKVVALEAQKAVLSVNKKTPIKDIIVKIGISLIIVVVIGLGLYFVKPLLDDSNKTEHTTDISVILNEIVETFEISTLDYYYSAIISEENTTERKFWFIELDPAVQQYAVQFEGIVKFGVNGKEVKLYPQYNGENKILNVTIPKAYLISHDAPLNDTAEVKFDFAKHTERANIGQYTELFNEKKKEMENKLIEQGLLEQAQQSAKKQIELLLNSIPEIQDNYTLKVTLE